MLDLCCYHMVAATSQCARDPEDCQIVCLRPTGGKHELPRPARKRSSHRLPGAVERFSRRGPGAVDAGRISRYLSKERPHGLQYFRPDGGRRRVIEINIHQSAWTAGSRSTSSAMSSARTECVRAPTEMRSTPLSA